METERDGHLPFLEFDIYRKLDGTLVMSSTVNLLTPNSTCNLDHTTIQPTYRPFFLPWFTEPGLFVTRKASRMSWSTKQIQQNFNPVIRTSKLEEKSTLVALLLYVQATYGQLSRMLAKRTLNVLDRT